MIPVILESPYKGLVHRNKAYLQLCIRDCIARGESPFASHQMLTDALDDNDPAERAQGIEAGLVWGPFAKRTCVYTDFGLSTGMKYGIARAEAEGRPVEYRTLPDFDADAFFTEDDEDLESDWVELLARARNKVPVAGACVIVYEFVDSKPFVLGLLGPKGVGLPGGKIEPGESPLVAAKRELEEETGYAVRPGATIVELPVRATDNGDTAHGFWLHAKDLFGNPRDSAEGIPGWMPPEMLVHNSRGVSVRFPLYNDWAFRILFGEAYQSCFPSEP